MRKILLSLALIAPGLALASDDTHSGHGMSSTDGMASHEGMASHDGMAGHEGMEGVHAAATVNSISDGMVNVSHGPIAEIGWPAMTMDMMLLEGAEIGEIEPGDEVMMMLEKGSNGMYGIRALSPKE